MIKLVVVKCYNHQCVCFECWILVICVVNRRLDEWTHLDQLDLDSVECAVDEKVENKVVLLVLCC